MLVFKNTIKNDYFLANALLNNPSLILPFSTCNVKLLGRGLRNSIATEMLSKNSPNQFTESWSGLFIIYCNDVDSGGIEFH